MLSDGFYLDGKNIVKAVEGKTEVLLSTDDMKIVGVHNAENAMAAIAVSDAIFIDGSDGHTLDIKAREFMWKEGMDYKCGTGHGVDTAVVMTAANMTNVFDMKFHEVIAMPR